MKSSIVPNSMLPFHPFSAKLMDSENKRKMSKIKFKVKSEKRRVVWAVLWFLPFQLRNVGWRSFQNIETKENLIMMDDSKSFRRFFILLSDGVHDKGWGKDEKSSRFEWKQNAIEWEFSHWYPLYDDVWSEKIMRSAARMGIYEKVRPHVAHR
jgi:hypothetical protein